MKPGIHPEYRPVLFHDTSADVYFLIGSTASTCTASSASSRSPSCSACSSRPRADGTGDRPVAAQRRLIFGFGRPCTHLKRGFDLQIT